LSDKARSSRFNGEGSLLTETGLFYGGGENDTRVSFPPRTQDSNINCHRIPPFPNDRSSKVLGVKGEQII
jgi:hypothetical protein